MSQGLLTRTLGQRRVRLLAIILGSVLLAGLTAPALINRAPAAQVAAAVAHDPTGAGTTLP